MTAASSPWTIDVAVRLSTPAHADWLWGALAPEASREVPRTRGRLVRADDRTLALRVDAKDTGAARAALNTYLGWIHLSLATIDRAVSSPGQTAGP